MITSYDIIKHVRRTEKGAAIEKDRQYIFQVNPKATKIDIKKAIEDMWETNFVQGLESLLVECAVVNDDIERDCFVSRVYCWFTEKLQERRDLPRKSKDT